MLEWLPREVVEWLSLEVFKKSQHVALSAMVCCQGVQSSVGLEDLRNLFHPN